MAQHRAPWLREMRDGERIRSRPRGHQEYCDVALEDLGKARLDPPGPVVITVAERVASVRVPDRGEDFRRNSGRVVTCEIHGASSSAACRRMQFCCAAASIRGPLVTCGNGAGQQTSRTAWILRRALL